MALDPIVLVLCAIFAAVILFVLGIEAALNRGGASRETVNRRMQMIQEGASTQEIIGQLRRTTRKTSPFLGPVGNAYTHLDYMITQAGLSVPTGRVAAIMGVAVAVLFVSAVLSVTSAGLEVSVFVALSGSLAGALVGGIGLPYFVIARMKARRHKKFLQQLPGALDIMVRSLRAGHPVSSAMALVTQEMPDPIGSELGLAVDEMTYGLDLREALENMSKRVDVEEFRYVVVAIGIQYETGGNLAELLHNLSRVIRDRAQLVQKVKALSSEGRMSAWVLCVLPFAVGTFLLVFNPSYYTDVMDDPLFWPGIGSVFGMMVLGILTMIKMVNFRV